MSVAIDQKAPPAPENPAMFLARELEQWQQAYRPLAPLGQSVWRQGFSQVAPDWACLADWTLELSTQLSVDFMAANQRMEGVHLANGISQLDRDIQKFKNDFSMPASISSRLLGRMGVNRQKDALQRAEKLEVQYQQIKSAKDRQLEDLFEVSRLATLLEDASGILLQQAPGIMQALAAPIEVSTSTPSAFEHRVARRQVENVSLAIGAIRQFLPRIESELTQKQEISSKLQEFREKDQDRLLAVRANLSDAVHMVNKALTAPPPDKASPIKAVKPRAPLLKPFNASSIKSPVSYSVLTALVRLAHPEQVPVSRQAALVGWLGGASSKLHSSTEAHAQAAAQKGYRRDIATVAGAKGVSLAWIPLHAGGFVGTSAMAMLLRHLSDERGATWPAASRTKFAQTIKEWSVGLGYDMVPQEKSELSAEARGVRGMKEVFQAAYNLSPDQPLATLHLLARAPHSPLGQTIKTANSATDDVIVWARRWLMSISQEGIEQDRTWGLAVGRIAHEQMMQPDYYRGAIFPSDEAILKFAKSLPDPPPQFLIGALFSLARTEKGLPNDFRFALHLFEDFSFENFEEEDFEALNNLCQEILKRDRPTSSLFASSLARWLAAPIRAPFALNHAGNGLSVLHAFTESGRVQIDPSIAPVDSGLVYNLARLAPALLHDSIKGREVVLSHGASVYPTIRPESFFFDLPPMPDAKTAAMVLSEVFPKFNGMAHGEMTAICRRAMERRDFHLIGAIQARTLRPPAADLMNLMQEVWDKGELLPCDWHQWLVSSDKADQDPQKIVPTGTRGEEFIGAAFEHILHTITPLESLKHVDRLASWVQFVANDTDTPADIPGRMCEILSRAFDSRLARIEEQYNLSEPKPEEMLTLDHAAAVLVKSLRGTDLSHWGASPEILAEAWKDVYREKWSATRSQQMGDRLSFPEPDRGELVLSTDPLSGSHANPRCDYWLYQTKSISESDIPVQLVRFKMEHLVHPVGSTHLPGMHFRSICVSGGRQHIIGLHREMELDRFSDLSRIMGDARKLAEIRACATPLASIDASVIMQGSPVVMEGLAYRKGVIHAAGIVGVDRETQSVLNASTKGQPLSLSGRPGLSRPNHYSPLPQLKAFYSDAKNPEARPLELCVDPVLRLPIQRLASFPCEPGRSTQGRDQGKIDLDEIMYSLLEDVVDQSPVAKPTPPPSKTRRSPFR